MPYILRALRPDSGLQASFRGLYEASSYICCTTYAQMLFYIYVLSEAVSYTCVYMSYLRPQVTHMSHYIQNRLSANPLKLLVYACNEV